MSSVFRPRRANAAARFTAVVVLPTPPFWLTMARTCPTRYSGSPSDVGIGAGAELFEGGARVRDPSLRFRAPRRMREKCREVLLGACRIAALEQQKRESVVRAAQLGIEIECATVAAHGVLEPPGLRERDRHVLQDARIARPVAQGEPVRGERSVVIALALERERFAQIVQSLRLGRSVGITAGEPAPPGHAFGGRGRDGRMRRRHLPVRGAVCERTKSYRLRHEAATMLLSSQPPG